MKRQTAHKIWKRFSLFPTQYTLEQIKVAHFILGKTLDPNLLEEWKELNGLSGLADEIRTNVGIVDVVIKAGPDGFIGTEDDITTIEKAQNQSIIQFVHIVGECQEELTSTLTTTCVDYANMRVVELKNCCRRLGLKGFSTLKKKELVALLAKEGTVTYGISEGSGVPETPTEEDT